MHKSSIHDHASPNHPKKFLFREITKFCSHISAQIPLQSLADSISPMMKTLQRHMSIATMQSQGPRGSQGDQGEP